MPAISDRPATPAISRRSDTWKYLAMAYGFAWIPWMICIRLHAPEMMLNLGVAGPALAAALVVLRRSPPRSPGPAHRPILRPVHRFRSGRLLLFLLIVLGCSVLLSQYYGARSGCTLHFQWDPWSLIPSIAPAWLISSVLSPDPGIRDLTRALVRSTRWSLLGLLIFPGMILAGDIFARWLRQPLVMSSGNGSITTRVLAALVLFLYNLLFVAALEETGWRGCLLPLFQKRWSPLQSTLFVWLAWALWHAPLDLSRPARFSVLQYLEIRVVFLIPIAVILTWLYNRSRGSVQASAIFHASMNTFPFVVPYWMPSFGLLFVVAAAAVLGDRMLRRQQLVFTPGG